jgi:hypothetical protein
LSWKKKLINFRIIRNVCKINYLGKIALENWNIWICNKTWIYLIYLEKKKENFN